jgi:hypothetical protein
MNHLQEKNLLVNCAEEITNFGVVQKCYIAVESVQYYSVQPPVVQHSVSVVPNQ